METVGVQAVCDFKNLELYNFLISGDLLDSPEWITEYLGMMVNVHIILKVFIWL